MFIAVVFAGLLCVYPQLSNGAFNFMMFCHQPFSLLGVYLAMKVARNMGFPKRANLVQNTSSVVTLIAHAWEMAERKRSSEVAFVFVDHGVTPFLLPSLEEYLTNEGLEKGCGLYLP